MGRGATGQLEVEQVISLRRRFYLLMSYGIGTAIYLILGGTVMWKLERPGEVSRDASPRLRMGYTISARSRLDLV